MLVSRYAVVAENTDPSPSPSVSPSADPKASPSASPKTTASPEPTETPSTSAKPSDKPEATAIPTASPETSADPEPSSDPEESKQDENKFEYRLIVSGKHFAIREKDVLIAHYEDVYLFGFHTFKDVEEGRAYYSEVADFAERDITVTAADPEYVNESSDEPEDEQTETDIYETPEETATPTADADISDAEPVSPETTPDTDDSDNPDVRDDGDITDNQNVTTENNPLDQLANEFEINPKVEKEELPEDAARPLKWHEDGDYVIALIDSGVDVSDPHVISAVSMLGDDPSDDNGHGTAMLNYIVAHNPNAKIISIKALDENGKGTVSSVYAAMEYAIGQGVKVINLSLSAVKTSENSIILDEIDKAAEQAIAVVGVAGNYHRDAKYYVPGASENAFIVGMCDETGKMREDSNFGESVDYSVVANSTSEAAARLTGWISARKLGIGIIWVSITDEMNNNHLIFSKSYDPDSS